MDDTSFNVLIDIIQDYSNYMKIKNHSLISKIYGMFKITMKDNL